MSALEALMSKARAAAKKKSPQTSTLSPSPKKRKHQGTDLDKTLVEEDHSVSVSEKPRSDRIAEMKSRFGLLKKKPGGFDPEKVYWWEKGERVPFMFLSLAFDLISNEKSHIVITDILCNMLRTVIATTPQDLLPTVYLSAAEVAPAHQGLGISKDSIIKAISEAFGRTESEVKEKDKKLGDLGLAAQESRSSQAMISKPQPLTVFKVFNTFQQIAKETGKDCKVKKTNRVKELLVATRDCEPLYLTRLLQAKLRLSFSGQTVLAALGQASVYNKDHSKPPPNVKSPLQEAASIVKKVFTVFPAYDVIVSALLSGGVWNLPKNCNFTLGVPISLMLAKPTTSVSEVLDRFQDTVFTCEYKYDGQRQQIHYMEDGTFELFSRNGERNTEKYPDVARALSRLKKPSVKSFILDCEVVAFDKEAKKLLPFQKLSTRARKNVNVSNIKVGVCTFAFDMLYLNGQQLIHENLNIRREKLYESFEEDPGYFQFATAITSSDVDEIQEFLKASVDIGCEGLMIKTLNSNATYEPAKRTNNWLKLKKDYMDSSIGDSVDLVPIGANHGQGKRTGCFGSFLLACYDADKKNYQSICHMGTGFSEAELEERSSSLGSKVIAAPKKCFQVRDGLKPEPDVWFEPTEVWEVKAADLTISPKYLAATGIVDPNKGVPLRFPRLIRVREDKKPEDATSSQQIAEMFQAQRRNSHSQSSPIGDDDD